MKVPATATFLRGEVAGVSNTTWIETTITAATAPTIDGPTFGVIPPASPGSAVSLDVTSAVLAAIAAGGGTPKISFALLTRTGNQDITQVTSRETVDPPRLLLSLTTGTSEVEAAELTPDLNLETDSNPWAGSGAVRISLARAAAHVDLGVFDIDGRLVRQLETGVIDSGTGTARWDGNDSRGAMAARGVYFVRAVASDARGAEIARGTLKIVLTRP